MYDFPLKLNRAGWPDLLTALLPASHDPRHLGEAELTGEAFSQAVSVLKFGLTYKTTRSGRFPRMLEKLASLSFDSPPVILDVGASDGSTSCDIARCIPFSKYFITDRFTKVVKKVSGPRALFLNENGQPLVAAAEHLVVYPELIKYGFPFKRIAKNMFMDIAGEGCLVSLINPDVRLLAGDVQVVEYDIFGSWAHDTPDLVVAANILNPCYFSDLQIGEALAALSGVMKGAGRLVVIDNRKEEQGTVFRLNGHCFEVEMDVNNGTDIRNLVLSQGKS